MEKNYLQHWALMSGTSMDGVDLSIIKSDGVLNYNHILDNYFEFDDES